MPRREDGRTTSTYLDRALVESRSIALVGPVPALDAADIGDRLARVWTPTSRLTVVPEVHGRSWGHDATHPPVDHFPDLADLPPGEILTALRRGSPRHLPLRVAICGDWLSIDHSHGIGDGGVAIALGAYLLSGDRQPADDRFERGLAPNAAFDAVRRRFARKPLELREALRVRARHAGRDAQTDTPAAAHGVGSPVTGWEASRRTMTATMPVDRVDALRAAVADTGIRMSRAAVTVALWRAAFEQGGHPIDERTMILFDCRRYLDRQSQEAFGNLAAGLPMRFPSGATPTEISDEIRAATVAAWPALTLAAGEVRGRLRPTPPPFDTGRTGSPARLRLSVSDLGTLPSFATVRRTAAPLHFYGAIEADGPDAITVLITELDGCINASASFFDAVVCRDVVGDALDRFCTRPAEMIMRLLTDATHRDPDEGPSTESEEIR